tara:strand:- start:2504 stop:2776 length:273 start_codon:yes stop_codon:yes gene_type:complete
MNVVDIFCNQLELIDNQTDAESLAFHYLPTDAVWVDELGFVCIQNEKTRGCVRIGLKKDDSWCAISTPFSDLVEKHSVPIREHLKRLFFR